MLKLTHWVYSIIVFFFAGVFLLIYNLITHAIFNYLLNLISPTTISMSMLLEPVGASILAIFILREYLGYIQILGIIIVLIGVYLFLKVQKSEIS